MVNQYRAGQRVRIEWPNGVLVEGPLTPAACGVGYILRVHDYAYVPDYMGDGRTVTILSEPRPEEPTGLGAVVVASTATNEVRRKWVLNDAWWWHSSGQEPHRWMGLIQPVVQSEGWTES
jgi:hypothetical protein